MRNIRAHVADPWRPDHYVTGSDLTGIWQHTTVDIEEGSVDEFSKVLHLTLLPY